MSSRTLVTALLCLLAMFLAVSPEHAQSNSNAQIILSGTGLPANPTPPCTPWGMWLWSQPATNNPYGGTSGNGDGSMYFYAIAPAEAHVDVSNVTLTGSSVSESASGTFPNGTTVNCSTISAHQTSPGKGILDNITCTLAPPGKPTVTCTATDIPITVDISNATK